MRQIHRIAIIGAGSWGTAVAKSIAESKPHLEITMWAYERSVAASINEAHENREYLPGIALPPNIHAVTSLAAALKGSSAVIFATPSKALYDIALKSGEYIEDDAYVAFLTKGFCRVEGRICTISQAIEQAVPKLKGRVIAVSGPSHAEEVSQHFHTSLFVGGTHAESRAVIAALLDSEYIRCRQTDDLRAVEVGGTLKNPAAIAAGIISELPRCGDNLAGALMSAALCEMIRLGALFGISAEHMVDISGLGDLVATALSDHSRNRRFGKDIALQIMKKKSPLGLWDRIVLKVRPQSLMQRMSKRVNYLAEGAYAIEPLIELAASADISIPVYRALYEVLMNRRDPSLLIETIKDPDRFEELLHLAKIHVSEPRRGLENVRGGVFRDLIRIAAAESFVAKGGANVALGHEPEEVIRNLKECISDDKREKSIIEAIGAGNYRESVVALISHYLAEIEDDFRSFARWLFYAYAAACRIRGLFSTQRERITVDGAIAEIRSARKTAGVVYFLPAGKTIDLFLVLWAIIAHRLPFPRFPLAEGETGNLRRLFLKMLGAYSLDRNKLKNLVYRETLSRYLAILAGHGVPVLASYAAESDPAAEIYHSAFLTSLYSHATEIVMVPVSVSFRGRVDTSSATKPLFISGGHVRFSKPLVLSEFTRQCRSFSDIPKIVAERWNKDRRIFPHWVLCRILAEADHRIETKTAEGMVHQFMKRAGRTFDDSPSRTFRKGLRYLEKRGIAAREGDAIVSVDRESVAYFSSLLG